jgi:Immunity protein 53
MSISALERWYNGHCNGTWEHGNGIRIDTLDNPGWTIRIDLRDTKHQDRKLEQVKIERTNDDWIQFWIEKQQFRAACGPCNLSETINLIVRWFASE